MTKIIAISTAFLVKLLKNSKAMTDISQKDQLRNWQRGIIAHMLRTRGAKYGWFLRYLHLFRVISKTPAKADFLESYYTLMRYLDDIVDGDAPLPAGYDSAETYLLDKIDFFKNRPTPRDQVDHFMAYCMELGQSFGETFEEETNDILHCLLFDARRMGKRIIFSNNELMAHYHRLDISGTVKATLRIFSEDPEKYLLLEPLGLASRFYYDLRDFEDDIRKGLVNISAEDMEAFGIQPASLDDAENEGVRRWFRAQAERGMLLLEKHRENLKIAGFRWSTRATFPLVYAGPARRFFRKVLKKTEGVDTVPPKAIYAPPVA